MPLRATVEAMLETEGYDPFLRAAMARLSLEQNAERLTGLTITARTISSISVLAAAVHKHRGSQVAGTRQSPFIKAGAIRVRVGGRKIYRDPGRQLPVSHHALFTGIKTPFRAAVFEKYLLAIFRK